MKLYELAQNYQNLLDLMDNEEVPTEVIEAALNEVGQDIEVKAENIAKLIKSVDADVTGLKEEEKRISARRKVLENRVINLKAYLEDAMVVTGKDKIKGNIFTLSIQKNPPSVNITDATAINEKYLVLQEPTLDKKAILADLKEGLEVPGAEIKQSKSLRIR